jgi:hypothetical protein
MDEIKDSEYPKVSIIEENGLQYELTEFSPTTYQKVLYNPNETPVEPMQPEMDEREQRELEVHSNIEYLTAISELTV